MERPLVRFRLRVTLGGFGRDEAAAERLLDAFAEAYPEAGPVISQDTEADTLAVVFSIEATNMDDAWDRGRPIFLRGARASGLEAPDAIEVNVSRIPASHRADEERELQPA